MTQARNPVGATETTFAIIEAIDELDGCGVTDLADHLGMPKSTVHNYLSTLEQEEYIQKEGANYQVGIKFLDIGASARRRLPIYEVAKPEVNQLAEETGELVNLLVEDHGKGVYVHQARGEQAVRVDSSVGARVDLHATAFGKAILAHLPDSRVEEIVERHGLPRRTERTVGTRGELKAALDEIRERGYGVDDQERLEGLRCVAAPILTDGDVLGAVSLSGPGNRMRGDYFQEELPTRLLETVNVIELNFTYA